MRLRSVGIAALMAVIVAACASAPEASGSSEGIQVHGEWTIDVYNADGSLDQHVEFSNALVGGVQLAQVLAGESTVEGWLLLWGSRTGTSSSPCNPSPIGTLCGVGGTGFDILQRTGDMLTLSGSRTAEQDGFIDFVSSTMLLCPSAGCGAPEFAEFTSKDVMKPDGFAYFITSGQMVQVQVEITFTSG